VQRQAPLNIKATRNVHTKTYGLYTSLIGVLVCEATGLALRSAPSSRSLIGQAPAVCASTVGAWVGGALAVRFSQPRPGRSRGRAACASMGGRA
jgi:hypothetical protein